MTQVSSTSSNNFYSQAKNDPKVLEKRKKRIKALDDGVQRILQNNPGRRPNWSQERLQQLDEFALASGKRCIMWDDEGAGFYIMLNWDWNTNQPAAPSSPIDLKNPGWWQTIKPMMKPPLFDPSVSDKELAAWIDKHTMKVHSFLDKLGNVRVIGPRSFALD